MSKNNENKLVPKLRFPEFENDGEWKEKKFDDLCKFVRGPFGGALKKEIFVNEGYAVYEQQHAIYNDFTSFRYFISQEKYNELKRFSVLPKDIIMSCSGTMGKFAVIPENPKEGIINQALLKLTVKPDYEIGFIKTSLELPVTQNKLLSQSAGGAIKNVVEVAQIKEINLLIPERKEQQKIAACLSSLDEVITAESQKLEVLKDHKKGLLQNMLPQAGETVPKFRFKEFEDCGEWEETTLGEIGEPLMCKRIFKEETTPNPQNAIPFYKIGTFGRLADAYISKEIYEEYKSRFSFPKVGDILISASGTIGRLVVYDGSPAYFQDSNIIWLGHNEEKILNKFLLHCYTNLKWQTSDGGVISRLYNSDFKRMKISFPEDRKEQEKIADTLTSIDDLIIAQNQKLEALQLHKKGLLQGLFPSVNDGDNGKI